MKQVLIKGVAFVIGSTIGLSAAVYSEEARKPEPKPVQPFPIIVEEMPEEEPEKPIKLNAGEKEMLQRVAICEAGYEDPDAQALVMRVIINRSLDESGNFPDTIEKVLYQRLDGHWQFGCMAEGGGFWNVRPNESSAQALEMVENGLDESAGALFFNQTGLKSWASRHRTFLFSAYGHDFYG